MKPTYNRSEIMRSAWAFVKRNGFTWAEALKKAWLNARLKIKLLTNKVVRFRFEKISGEIREAFGTLMSSQLPATATHRNYGPDLQVYFDKEKDAFRSFKKHNLLAVY